jgi:hypothetical protein
MSFVAVMMWQPIASAWKMFRSSRGLAQMSSAFGRARMTFTDSAMIGTGSRPVSAIRPANTEMIAESPGRRHSVTCFTCSRESNAVTFSFTPALDKRSMSGPENSRFVFVTGIFTFTFFPHEAISSAWPSMVPKSSAKTSNDTGRSGIALSTSRANAL